MLRAMGRSAAAVESTGMFGVADIVSGYCKIADDVRDVVDGTQSVESLVTRHASFLSLVKHDMNGIYDKVQCAKQEAARTLHAYRNTVKEPRLSMWQSVINLLSSNTVLSAVKAYVRVDPEKIPRCLSSLQKVQGDFEVVGASVAALYRVLDSNQGSMDQMIFCESENVLDSFPSARETLDMNLELIRREIDEWKNARKERLKM